MMSSTTALTYPTEDQYSRWQDRAEDLEMTMSEFMQLMVEAGIKADQGFDVAVQPDETEQELRQQRNQLKEELDRARDRIEELEEQVYYSERETLRRYVEEHPGASFDELVAHMQQTVPERIQKYIDGCDLYADRWEDDDGVHDGYFPTAGGAEEHDPDPNPGEVRLTPSGMEVLD